MTASATSALDHKIERWRQELLDMSMRNQLLNFKPRSAVQVVAPTPGAVFEEIVLRERTMPLRERTDDVNVEDRFELVMERDPRGTEHVLQRMRLRARGSVQEQGVNILFLSLGVVTWYDDEAKVPGLRSPLVLVPVELIKEGPLAPYRVRAIEDEIVVNPNLAYKLKTEYSLTLPELPEELESLDGFLESIRAAIAPIPGWGVGESAYLGLFSFAKLSMYQELLVEHERLAAHPFINALAGDPTLLPPLPDHPRADRLDAMVRPADSFQVLDADSSQQEAIEMSKRGISFVLQGPPGTGKSQTISNIIAEALAQDKRVLFVAEKMAALEVVKGRLDDRGLGDYTLEIHSQGVSKTAVMEELRRCMRPAEVHALPMDDLRRLEQVRDDLDHYVQAMHEVREPLGRSAYQALSRLAALHAAPDLPVAVPDIASLRPEDLEERLRLVKKVQSQREVVESMDDHPWRDLRTEGWTKGDEAEVAAELRELRQSTNAMRAAISRAAAAVPLPAPSSLSASRALLSLLHRTSTTPGPMEGWLVPGRPEELLRESEALEASYREGGEDDRWLRDRYRDGARTLDAKGLLYRFEAEHQGLLRSLSSRYRADRGQLMQHRRDGRRPDHGEMVGDLRRLVAVQERSAELKVREERAGASFGPRFRGAGTDWNEIRSSLTWTSELLREAPAPLDPSLIRAVRDVPAGRALEPLVREGEGAAVDLSRSLDRMRERFLLPEDEAPQDVRFEELLSFADRHLTNLPSIRERVEAATLEAACQTHGLEDLFRAARQGELSQGDAVAAFEKRSYRLWFEHLCSSDPRLHDLRGEDREDAVARFRELDQRQMAIAQARLRGKLSAQVERALSAPAEKGGELAVLRRELAKKKRFKQLRQLFQECPHVLLRLKPCLLMSPLSVSRFLDPAAVRFDLVVFDEASQVRPEDAVGSIMRGAQVIVVGDSKQLPPTSFFRSEAAESEDEEGEDLESILDECTALSIPQHMLLWHYRSRHESLIAFSNQRIYGGLLNTFPSAGHEPGEWGVEHVQVPDGVYERGSSRTNPQEARKVAELVFEHFTAAPSRSLGVIAFSEAQQMAILDVLDEMRRERPEMEEHFTEDGEEEFFVKNLESVQGDERDVMIFSVGYGRDAQGRMVQNFGPLNTAGGERRLNVAITRARMHIKLVSSIGPEDVDGSASQGARMLKDYLAYAASGGSKDALPAVPEDMEERSFTGEMEEDIEKALVAEGWRVHRQVGCSSYRIDLAVEDPERPGTFLLGIVCDGESYRSGRTARDRDRLRESVLQGLGWNIHHVWSMDWVDGREGEMERIRKRIATLRTAWVDEAPGESEEAVAETAPPQADPLLRAALREVISQEGPIGRSGLIGALSARLGREVPEDVFDTALGAVLGDGSAVVRGDFVWPAGMARPPVRGPRGGEPVRPSRVAVEEVGEAALYVMGADVSIGKDELVERLARFYRNEHWSDDDVGRLDDAIAHLVERGLLTAEGTVLRRPR